MARMGLFARVGGDDVVVPILASTKCDYKVPLTYPDEVLVGARPADLGPADKPHAGAPRLG